MFKYIKKITLIFTAVALPILIPQQIFADSGGSGNDGKTATQILDMIVEWISRIVPIVIGIGLLVFLWGVVVYFISSDSKNKKQGLVFITWGIVALFVMVSIWGLVNLLQQGFLGEGNYSRAPEEDVKQLEKLPENNTPSVGDGTRLGEVIQDIAEIIADIIPLLILTGVLVFLWGVFKYAFSSDPKSKETARNIMIWGVIGLFVMVSIWGLVNLLQQSVLNETDSSAPPEDVDKLSEEPTGVRQVAGGGTGVSKIIMEAVGLVAQAIPVIVSLGILLFLWGIFKYVSSDSAKIKSEGAAYMAWGVVTLLVMGLTWGFVKMIGDSAGVSITNQPNIGTETVTPGELIRK